MNKTNCQYAIIRFAPFVETGEFANVGIVMIAPNQRYFNFRLEINRYGRVTRFFEQLEAKVYRATLYNLRDELRRANEVLKGHGFDKRLKNNDVGFAQGFFKEIVRPRENIVRFSEIRTVIADNPEEKLKELFGFYIERNFVTKEYQEAALEKGVRQWLYNARIGDRFTRATIGDDFYHANFPFVECKNEKPLKIIKPLNLAQDEPSKIIDHGGTWLFRVEQLKKRNKLPEKVLFTIAGPEQNEKRKRACHEIETGLKDIGVNVIPYKNRDEIVDFAISDH